MMRLIKDKKHTRVSLDNLIVHPLPNKTYHPVMEGTTAIRITKSHNVPRMPGKDGKGDFVRCARMMLEAIKPNKMPTVTTKRI